MRLLTEAAPESGLCEHPAAHHAVADFTARQKGKLLTGGEAVAHVIA